MDIPTIHCCNALTVENEALLKKYKKLTRRYKTIEKQFSDLQERFKHDEIAKNVISAFERRDAAATKMSQDGEKSRHLTVPHGGRRNIKKENLRQVSLEGPKKLVEDDRNNKRILSMHNQLIKKYEREMKLNTSRVEQMTRLALEKSDLQQLVNEKDQEIIQLKERLEAKEKQIRAREIKKRLSPKPSANRREISAVKKENERLRAENKRLKDELQGLDRDFFDEIEDLKFALQKSARLNTQYERTLKKLCKKYDIDFASYKSMSDKELKRRSKDRDFAV